MNDHDALLQITALLDGVEWTPDTLEEIAAIMRQAGYRIRDRADRDPHVHDYEFSRPCGARVCYDCGDHKGLERCYCGWSRSGRDGRRELIEMGETLDPDY